MKAYGSVMQNRIKTQKAWTWVEIDLDRLQYNLEVIRNKIGFDRKIIAVIKADAYGHGAVQIARFLLEQGVEYLAVATLEEGIELRMANINSSILLLNAILPERVDQLLEYELIPTVYTTSFAEKLAAAAYRKGTTVAIHIRIDLASNGLGMDPDQAVSMIDRISCIENLQIEALYTHLVSAYGQNFEQVITDLQTFDEVHQQLATLNKKPQLRPALHVASSPAIISIPNSYYDMVRVGTGLYGLPSFEEQDENLFKPVMSIKSTICDIQSLDRNEMKGYTFSIQNCSNKSIATIPIGYSHAPYLLSMKKIEVLIRGKRVSALGTANMSNLFLDITDMPEAKIGDEVVLLGQQGQEKNLVQHIVQHTDLNIVQCESICFISPSIPRIYV